MSSILRAAWVPDSDDLDWETAADLAVAWAQAECRDQNATGVLVLNAFGVEQQIPSLSRFAGQHAVTTPAASPRRVSRGTGPVLAYVPDEKTLDFATQLAHGSSLVVVESEHRFPLQGWASQLGAVDLTRPDEQPEPLDPALARAIERLDFHKNNGFGDLLGKQQAQRILRDLRDAGKLDSDLLLGAVAARGASARAVRNLGKLIEATGRRR